MTKLFCSLPWLFPLALSSCIIGTFAPTTRHVPFNEKDFVGYDRTGTSSIHGQASADYQGIHHLAQGEKITLMPITPYTDEMVSRELGDGVLLTRPDARFTKYAHHTRTDTSGHYAFTGLPAGRYYLVGFTEWDTGNVDFPFDFQFSVERVTLGAGQSLKIDATHNPLHPLHPHGIASNAWSGD